MQLFAEPLISGFNSVSGKGAEIGCLKAMVKSLDFQNCSGSRPIRPMPAREPF